MALRVSKWLYKLLVAPVVLLMLLSAATPVYAIDAPDSISVESIRVYEGIWETGDMLFLVEYKVMDDPDPSEDPWDTYLVGVWAGAVPAFMAAGVD